MQGLPSAKTAVRAAIPVPEQRRRLAVTMTAAAAVLALSRPVLAAPQGGTVTSGAATISQSGVTTDVSQSTNKATINWQSFSIAGNETVNFSQPSSSAMTLNRVIGNERSVIDGALNANGKVFLVNSAGILIGGGARINASGFTASALNISDDDFNNGNFTFTASGSGSGEVINLGAITVSDGGHVVLLGKSVSNQGVIVATKGTVALAGGNKVTLNFNGDSLVDISVDEGVLNALVENRQAIYADGGTVILSAKAADGLLSAQVNNTGLIQARTIDALKGNIQLYAHNGTTRVDGTLDASAPDGDDGGTIETGGDTVKVADSAHITTRSASGTTGTWLIDPLNYTVAASGGDATGAALSAALSNTSVTITADGSGGNITINDAVTWSDDTSLTLTAADTIDINKPITAEGTSAGLTLNYGGDYAIDTANGASVTLSGASATLHMNGNTYTLIRSMSQLDLLDGYNAATGTGTASNVSGYYALAGDLDASGTTYGNAVVSAMNGTLAGLGHTISNLTINAGSTNYIALIGKLGSSASYASATVRDLGLEHATVTGKQFVGSMVGHNRGTISNTYSTETTVTATYQNAGGLAGYNFGGAIKNSYATGSVTGYNETGGLVGTMFSAGATVTDSWANVTVTGASNTGGLIGSIGAGDTVRNSYALGSVTGVYNGSNLTGVGGLAGTNAGTITNSTSSGAVTATNASNVGGLAGSNSGILTDIGSTGAVNVTWTIAPSYNQTASQDIGGLVGNNSGAITRGSAYGNVTVTSHAGTASYVGGLVGNNQGGAITASHAYGNVTGIGTVAYIGGFAGQNLVGGSITNSTSSGNVTGSSSVGGFVGSNSATISGSRATGNATATTANYVGGFAGSNGNTGYISNSTASGSVTGKGYVGGFAGQNTGTLNGVSTTSTVNGGTFYMADGTPINASGALVGNNTGTIVNSSATNSGANGLVGRNWGNGTVTNTTFHNTAEAGAATTSASRLTAAAQDAITTAAPTAGAAATTGSSSADDHIVFADAADYSADINGIEVDGVRYDLEDRGGDAKPQSGAGNQTQR